MDASKEKGPKAPVAVVPGYLAASDEDRAEIDRVMKQAAADRKAGRGGIRAEFEAWKKAKGYE